MKILAVSDEECPALWDYYIPGRLKDYDLIISCGDLKPEYLSFLVTMGRSPVLYVHGNHDGSYEANPPKGCDCIDGHYVVYHGVRIMGLGGCRRYHPGPHQYTNWQMSFRIAKMALQLLWHRGVDIVVTHAPPYGVGDDEDPAHWGFEALLKLIDRFHPQYLLHGHVHMTYGRSMVREKDYHGTTVVNTYERYVLEIPDRSFPLKHFGQVRWKTRQKKPEYNGLTLDLD